MSKNLPCTCLVEGCRFYGIINYADIEQIRWHLRKEHEYTELVKVAYKNNIVNSEHDFKKHEWLIRKIADLSIVKELANEF